MSDRRQMFKVLNDNVMTGVPWEVVEPHAKQAYKNHSQSLRTLHSRGGLSIEELFYVLTDRDFPTLISKASVARDAAYRLEIMRLLYKFEKARIND